MTPQRRLPGGVRQWGESRAKQKQRQGSLTSRTDRSGQVAGAFDVADGGRRDLEITA